VEDGADDGEFWGKTTSRPWGLATWKESPNGGAKRWLAGGVLPQCGEKLREKGWKLQLPWPFIGGGERGCVDVSKQAAPTARRA
jgi:hypothetical protein